MVQHIDMLFVGLVSIAIAALFGWMVWPTSNKELLDILTPEKLRGQADEVQEDLHLSEIRPSTTGSDFSQT